MHGKSYVEYGGEDLSYSRVSGHPDMILTFSNRRLGGSHLYYWILHENRVWVNCCGFGASENVTFESSVTGCVQTMISRLKIVTKEDPEWNSYLLARAPVASFPVEPTWKQPRVTGRPQIIWLLFECKMNTFWRRMSRDIISSMQNTRE